MTTTEELSTDVLLESQREALYEDEQREKADREETEEVDPSFAQHEEAVKRGDIPF